METPYMYMFVREDLSHPQQIVQTAHAVDELNKKYPHEPGNHMVLCGAKSEEDLLEISMHLCFAGINHEMFMESDINQYTAIATTPLRGKERNALKHFKLKQ